MKWRQPEY
jgi:hypothetical protein